MKSAFGWNFSKNSIILDEILKDPDIPFNHNIKFKNYLTASVILKNNRKVKNEQGMLTFMMNDLSFLLLSCTTVMIIDCCFSRRWLKRCASDSNVCWLTCITFQLQSLNFLILFPLLTKFSIYSYIELSTSFRYVGSLIFYSHTNVLVCMYEYVCMYELYPDEDR